MSDKLFENVDVLADPGDSGCSVGRWCQCGLITVVKSSCGVEVSSNRDDGGKV